MSNKSVSITKSELVSDLSEATSLTKSQINDVFKVLEDIIFDAVKKGHSITIPNICKIYVHKRKATPARQMKSPLTGEMLNVSAKPARKVVKVKAVRALKDSL